MNGGYDNNTGMVYDHRIHLQVKWENNKIRLNTKVSKLGEMRAFDIGYYTRYSFYFRTVCIRFFFISK